MVRPERRRFRFSHFAEPVTECIHHAKVDTCLGLLVDPPRKCRCEVMHGCQQLSLDDAKLETAGLWLRASYQRAAAHEEDLAVGCRAICREYQSHQLDSGAGEEEATRPILIDLDPDPGIRETR